MLKSYNLVQEAVICMKITVVTINKILLLLLIETFYFHTTYQYC